MPQGRIILKSISESRKLASLKTDGARLLYTWLIPHLDVNGSFSADPIVLKGKIFTRLKKSKDTIKAYIENLEAVGLIVCFQAKGDCFLNVPDFKEKQPNLRPEREGKTSIPLLKGSSSGVTPDQLPHKQSKAKSSKVKQSKTKSGSDFSHSTMISDLTCLADELDKLLKPKTKSSRKALLNFILWLKKRTEDHEDDTQAVCEHVMLVAKDSVKKGRLPIAYFFKRADQEFGYRAKVAKQKEGD